MAVRRADRRLLAALLAGAGAWCAPAPAAAADPLPRVSIRVGGEIPQEKRAARMTIRDGGRTVYVGRIGIERRGQSSQRFPKQSWGLELRDRKGDNRNAALLGMPADDDWILYAGYNDKSLMRNVVAYATARRLGGYAARTRFVEVRLDGRYLARGAGGRWRLGPVWDFDISMGNSDYGPSAMLEGSMLADRAWASRLYRDPAFVDAVVARWGALRARGLRRDLLRAVDGTARRLQASGAAARNFARWPVLGVRIWPNPPEAVTRTTYASEVAALRSWLVQRIAWLDGHVRALRPGR